MFDLLYNMTTILFSVLLTIEGGIIFFLCTGLITALIGILLFQMPVANKSISAVVKSSSFDPFEEKYVIKVRYDAGGEAHEGSFLAPFPMPLDQNVIVFIDPQHPQKISNYPVKKNAALICMITGSVVFLVAAIALFTIPRVIHWRQEQKRRLQQQLRRVNEEKISRDRLYRAKVRSMNRRQLERLLHKGDDAYRRRVTSLLRENKNNEWYINQLVPHLLREKSESAVADYWSNNEGVPVRRASSLKRNDPLLQQ